MSKKPKDHTTIVKIDIDLKTGKSDTLESVIDYESINDPFVGLPSPALCDKTIDEWSAYKRWEVDEKAWLAKEKIAQQRRRW